MNFVVSTFVKTRLRRGVILAATTFRLLRPAPAVAMESRGKSRYVVSKRVRGFFLLALPVLASAADLSVEWSRVPKSLVEGRKKVEVILRGASGSLEGKALAVLPDGLRIDVKKLLRGTKVCSVGECTVPASKIFALQWNKRRVRGRIIGTIAGGAISVLVVLGTIATSEGGDVGSKLTAISVSAVAAGYGIGWAADRGHYTTIYIERK